ncbi:MAG: diguanylate cyclase, partial [Gammaproteobacteria bacterium]|nr:diguanylate cyclase [Gammaproteobacteria bacterium]
TELALSGTLLRHHTTNLEFASLWIARMSGDIVVASAVKNGQAVPWSGPVAGVAMLNSFKQAVIKGELYVSPVEKGATTAAAPMVFVSVPITLNGNPRWGFVQGLLNLRNVAGGLVSQGAVDSASVIITDQRNRVILASRGLALEPFSDLSGHPLMTAATTEGAYTFSGRVNNDEDVARYVAVSKPLDNGWRVIATAIRAKADLTLLIYMSIGLIWSLLAIVLARGLAPLYGHVVARPLQKLEESLDIFDAERTLSIIPKAPEDAPKEIRRTYARVRESMRSSRDAYRNMMKAVNEGIELRQKLSFSNNNDGEAADGQVQPVDNPKPSGPPDLAVAPEAPMLEATWIGRLDSVTELSGLDVFEGFFGEAWTLGVTDSRPMAVILLRIGATDDEMIKFIAQKIKISVGRTLDLVARISAWEFGMILPDTDVSGALSVAGGICESIQGDECGQPTTIGIGVGSIIPNANGNAQSFLDLCHRALETANQAGDGQIAYINDKGKLVLHASDDMIDWDPGTTRISQQ